jgi:hypothetical protein
MTDSGIWDQRCEVRTGKPLFNPLKIAEPAQVENLHSPKQPAPDGRPGDKEGAS